MSSFSECYYVNYSGLVTININTRDDDRGFIDSPHTCVHTRSNPVLVGYIHEARSGFPSNRDWV